MSEGISIVIPTCGRERGLLDTIESLCSLSRQADEILVVDQSASHEEETTRQLEQWNKEDKIRWLRLPRPSIPRAMNAGLCASLHPVVLFLDDDIRPGERLVEKHLEAHRQIGVTVVAGRVFQPWHRKGGPERDGATFSFTGDKGRWVYEFMGGNFSIKRSLALQVGGMDENFVKVAYRFEKEFAHRLLKHGEKIRYEPAASIDHLKLGRGGNRMYGSRLYSPAHGVGEYYYFLRARGWKALGDFPGRLISSVTTRRHLLKPWWVPVTLVAECAAAVWAAGLCLRGPRFVECEK